MEEFQILKNFGILNESAKSINLLKEFTSHLASIKSSSSLQQGLEKELKENQASLKTQLANLDDKDRALIISIAFDKLASLQAEGQSQPISIYENEFASCQTLIDLNNDVNFAKCFARNPQVIQEQLSILPENQFNSFASYLDKRIEEESQVPDMFQDKTFEILTNLHTTVQNHITSCANAEQQTSFSTASETYELTK